MDVVYSVTSSVRKSIVELRKYATELEGERIALEEELSFYQRMLSVERRKNIATCFSGENLMRPIKEMKDVADLNLLEANQIRLENRVLKRKVSEIKTDLGIPGPNETGLENEVEKLESILRDYQAIFREMWRPPQLPYPYSQDAELDWAIFSYEKANLGMEAAALCENMASFSSSGFDCLPFEKKREAIAVLDELKHAISDIIRRLKRVDLDVEDISLRAPTIRSYLRRYAALSLSMQKMRFC
jgi:hypothetical protein